MKHTLMRFLLIFSVLWPVQGLSEENASDGFIQPLRVLRERIVSDLSHNAVAITANFTGSEILVFGAIERNRFLHRTDGLPDVIIIISGPKSALTVRKKNRVNGIWTNTEAMHIAAAPSFFSLATTSPVGDILDQYTQITSGAQIDDAIVIAGSPRSVTEPADFRDAVIRLRQKQGLYKKNKDIVNFDNGTLFSTRVDLPRNIQEGEFMAHVLLVRSGRVIDQASLPISVHKDAFEAAVHRFSVEHSTQYGLFAVFLALLIGWLGSEFFRRLKL